VKGARSYNALLPLTPTLHHITIWRSSIPTPRFLDVELDSMLRCNQLVLINYLKVAHV